MKVAFVSLGCAKNLVNTEQMMALARDAATAFSYNGNYSLNVDVSWTENGVTVTQPDNNMSYQCNLIGKTYLVLALVAMNE